MADDKDNNITRLRPKVVASNDIEAGIKATLAESRGGKYDGALILTRHADTKAWSWRGAGHLDIMELVGFLEIVKLDLIKDLRAKVITE